MERIDNMSLFAYGTMGFLGCLYYKWVAGRLTSSDVSTFLVIIFIQLFYLIGFSAGQFFLFGVGLVVAIYLKYHVKKAPQWFGLRKVFIVAICLCLALLIVTEFFNGIYFFEDKSDFFFIHQRVKKNINIFPFKIQEIDVVGLRGGLFVFTFENITVLFPTRIGIEDGELYWARQYSRDRRSVWVKYGEEMDPLDY